MMVAVDKADSAQYERDDILDPNGWVLLNYLMDARTGLGRFRSFRSFRISNYALMLDLIEYCRDHTIDQILDLPDVQERVDLYFAHGEPAREQIQRCATVHGNRSCSTCAAKRRSTRRIASWSTPCSRSATSRST